MPTVSEIRKTLPRFYALSPGEALILSLGLVRPESGLTVRLGTFSAAIYFGTKSGLGGRAARGAVSLDRTFGERSAKSILIFARL